MAVSADFHRFVIEQLNGLGGVMSRSMFGGIGLYHEGLFFGLIDDDTLYLKVDGTNRGAYISRGMKPFCPYPDKPEYQMGGYYQVPADVLEDAAQLEVWARQSRQVALSAQARKAKPKTRAKAQQRTPAKSKRVPTSSVAPSKRKPRAHKRMKATRSARTESARPKRRVTRKSGRRGRRAGK